MQLYFSTLGFRYFEFRFIYERIPNQIRIRIFGIFVLALYRRAQNFDGDEFDEFVAIRRFLASMTQFVKILLVNFS